MKSRNEFVKYIVDYLKNNCSFKIYPNKVENGLIFYEGTDSIGGKLSPVALVGYPGSRKDIRDLPTPWQTEVLPIIFRFWSELAKKNELVPLIILGHSFDEVFLRKVSLLRAAIKNIMMIQYINVRNIEHFEDQLVECRRHMENSLKKEIVIKNERGDLKSAVIDYLSSGNKLGQYDYEIIGIEVPAGEGTIKSESIDILALERQRHWLTVIELKYEDIGHRRLESSILQGLDYCRWIEENKRALAMLLPMHKIDTRRRTRLVLINGPKKFPAFYGEFIKSWRERDRYQEIELYYTNDRIPVTISPIPE
jgi:hypothetical protein